MVVSGLLLLVWTFRTLGRRVGRSRYRVELWRRRDSLVSTASVAALAVFTLFWLLDKGALIFYPYPRFTLPTFNSLLGLASLAPVAPVLAAPQRRGRKGL